LQYRGEGQKYTKYNKINSNTENFGEGKIAARGRAFLHSVLRVADK